MKPLIEMLAEGKVEQIDVDGIPSGHAFFKRRTDSEADIGNGHVYHGWLLAGKDGNDKLCSNVPVVYEKSGGEAALNIEMKSQTKRLVELYKIL